ncbi:XRE family transcriptional regulator [Xanthobacter agilis]|uniref:Phage repressor protein C with HTH and peptisase S24 domain n=1 Tax=Xanthobacter agilis TaxID=47492 RepID=A0ABU0LFY4_XANAG|nr:helix-turn-helix domain-containing protein [Xanthobacter agilis]MDQ0505980.1 phage repressor protein C with HTH and peptisase S24 domain [Xanthobacter agilis]
METLGSRIRYARDACGLTQDDIAAHFGIKRVSVTQWEGGTTKPAVSRLSKLADLLHTSAEWLLDGRGDAPAWTASADQPSAKKISGFKPEIIPGSELVGAKDFPIYAAAAGGEGHQIVTFEPIEWVKRPSILEGVPGSYGLLVYGDSMDPAFCHGDMALIHPGLGPAAGSDVVLYDHPPNGDAEAIIKRLVSWSEQEWRLKQYNPPREWTAFRADWPTCHRVVGKYSRR